MTDRKAFLDRCNARRDAQMRRSHEIELLLDAGLDLAEAIEIADKTMSSRAPGGLIRLDRLPAAKAQPARVFRMV